MWSQLSTIVDTIQGAVNTLENQLRIEESINTLETCAQRYHDGYAHYLDQRAALELGYLAESILPRSYVRSILNRAMTSMVKPLNLMWYYQHSAVTPLWVGDGTLVYWTRIPLVNTAKYLLYHIQVFPVRAVNHTVTLGVNHVVAIDTQGGGIFTPRYCHGQSPIVCRTGAISRSPALSCERGIITGDKSQRRSCQITVTPTSNDTIITEVQLAEYIIVTPGECFTENCPGEAMTRHCLPLGTHLITVPDLCNFQGHTWTLTGVIHGRENFTLPHQYLDHHPIALPFLVHDKTLKYAVANPTFNTIARLETIPLEDLVPASAPSDWTIITDHGPGFSWLAILIVLLLLIGLLLLYHFRTRSS